MTTHTDTKTLQKYNAASYPTIEGGEAKYLTSELQKASLVINRLVDLVKLMEARMNTNGLT